MKVEQLMMRSVKVCRESDSLNTAAQLMWENDCGCVPVISADGDGAVVGMITDRDIAMAAYTQGKNLLEIPAAVAMARNVVTCRIGDEVRQVESLMREKQVRRLPVVDAYNHVQGIISIHDLALEAQRERGAGRKEIARSEIADTLAAICHPRGERQVELAA